MQSWLNRRQGHRTFLPHWEHYTEPRFMKLCPGVVDALPVGPARSKYVHLHLRHGDLISLRYFTNDAPQCDEAHPQCQKCVGKGKQCPGYQTQITIRDMSLVAEKKVETRVEKVLQNRASAELNAQIDGAIREFFADYVLYSDVVMLHTRFLKDVYESPDVSDCYLNALRATALKSRANKQGLVQMAAEADQLYGVALAQLVVALADPAQIRKDSTLAAAFVLGLCEVRLAWIIQDLMKLMTITAGQWPCA